MLLINRKWKFQFINIFCICYLVRLNTVLFLVRSYLVYIVNFIMDKNIEQRVCPKFSIANGISCSEYLKKLHKAYGASTLSKRRAYEWYEAFEGGRDVMKDLPCSGRPDNIQQLSAGSPADTRSYVALLKELCQEFRLAGVEYELVGDTGPPHLRHFTVRARIGQHERLATSTTKKTARQLAAEKLYTYLRENLARVTRDFNEEEALARAHDKAMERFQEPSEECPRRPDLGQRIADYHLGLTSRLDEETRAKCVTLLKECEPREPLSPERVLGAAADALRLDLQYGELQREGADALAVVELTGTAPDLVFGGDTRAAAARHALGYVRLVLCGQVTDDTHAP